MKNSHKKYGLTTAVSMVVGSVIGSGVFFKTESINTITDGSVPGSVTAWGVGALVMILCLLTFAEISGKYGGEGGLYSITKNINNSRYSRFTGIFAATVYYPSLVSVLAYITSKYTLLTFGKGGFLCVILPFLFLVISFLQNAFLPEISGKVQVVTTILKLIPLLLMIALGIPKGNLPRNIENESSVSFYEALFPSVTATLFAYEGWISATSIGKNLKNSKKNLPLALVIGGIIIAAVYILYYFGIMGAVKSETLINYGQDGIKIAFSNILGKWGGLLTAFVAISCYGALNALVMGCGHSIGEIFGKKPKNSYFIGALISFFWLIYLIAQQDGPDFVGRFRFDSTELPVVTIYALYIPIFFGFAKKEKNIRTTILCIGGICASLFASICGVLAHLGEIASYGAILFSIALLSNLSHKKTE